MHGSMLPSQGNRGLEPAITIGRPARRLERKAPRPDPDPDLGPTAPSRLSGASRKLRCQIGSTTAGPDLGPCAVSGGFGVYDQQVAGAVVGDLVRYAAEDKARYAAHSSVADHDQVGADLLCDLDEGVCHILHGGMVKLGRHPLALGLRAQLGPAAFGVLAQLVEFQLAAARVGEPGRDRRMNYLDRMDLGSGQLCQCKSLPHCDSGSLRAIGADDDHVVHTGEPPFTEIAPTLAFSPSCSEMSTGLSRKRVRGLLKVLGRLWPALSRAKHGRCQVFELADGFTGITQWLQQDVIGTGLEVLSDPGGENAGVTPGNYRVHEAVARTAGDVVVAVTEMFEVVHVIGQLEVSVHVFSRHPASLVAVAAKNHGLFGDEQFVRTEGDPGEGGVIWGNEV